MKLRLSALAAHLEMPGAGVGSVLVGVIACYRMFLQVPACSDISAVCRLHGRCCLRGGF